MSGPQPIPAISIIVPTRKRPERARQMLDSIKRTVREAGRLEIIFVIDDDDPSYSAFDYEGLAIQWIEVRAGATMGALNMAGYRASRGAHVMLLNDDVVVRTPGWDDIVLKAFQSLADGVALIHVNDRLFEDKLCTFPFMTRATCERIGGICPEGYRRYRIDDHIYHIFDLLGVLGHRRILYLPDVVFEHHNFIETAEGAHLYQPDPRIHAIDTDLFEALQEERKRVAIELAGWIDENRSLEVAATRAKVLEPFNDAVALRRPEYVQVWRIDVPPQSEKARVTVGVVSADLTSPHAQACLSSVKRFTSNYELIVIDNNRGPNFNHAREMNRLIAACRTDYLVLMDDDVIVEAGWLDGMLRCLSPDVGIVTPLHKDKDGALSYAGVVMTPDHSGHHTHAFHVPAAPFATQTMCSAIFLIDIGKCGHLRVDESYSKYFLDIEYGLRVWEAGYQVVCAPQTQVTHIGGATLTQGSQLSNQLFEEQRRHFVRTWIDTGRYEALENAPIWRDNPAIFRLLDAPARLDRLLQSQEHDKLRFLEEAHAFFEELREYPALLHWVSEKVWKKAHAEAAPDFQSKARWREAALVGQLDWPVLIEANWRGFNLILWRGRYFAAPEGFGHFNADAAARGDYHHLFQAERIALLKIMIEANLGGAPHAPLADAALAPPAGAARGFGPRRAPGVEAVALVEEGFERFNIVRAGDWYYALPQEAGAFIHARAEADAYPVCFKAASLEEAKQRVQSYNRHPLNRARRAPARLRAIAARLLKRRQIRPALAPTPAYLVEEGFEGFNLVRSGAWFYALPQSEGAFDLERAEHGHYSVCFKAPTLEVARSLVEVHARSPLVRLRRATRRLVGRLVGRLRGAQRPDRGLDEPVLVQEGFQGHNIIFWRGKHYAIAQGDGAFDPERVARGAYRSFFEASSVAELKLLVNASGVYAPGGRLSRLERALERLGLAHSIRQRGRFVETDPSGQSILQVGDWYYALPEGGAPPEHPLRAQKLSLLRLALGSRASEATQPSARAATLHSQSPSLPNAATDGVRDSLRWIAASPVERVSEDYRGFAIYRYEFKYFAIPLKAGVFSFEDFKFGAYGACPIGHSIPEVERLIDRRRDSAEAGKSLLFACSQGADFDALLAEFDPAETDIVLPLASAPPSPAFEYIRVAQDDLPSWAGELVAGKHEDLVQTLSARKYDRVIIPWRYPETWRDNALEAAAARICDYVEVRHAGGGQRGFYGENLHRLLYNKAYLASMFASVPQPAGLDVLEVGCSDGMVCDIFALLGAKRIVGIDVMESVGCSYRNPAIEYHSMQADALSFPDKSFDLVYSIATLEHVPHPSRVLEEIVRVLKPGGYAYVQAAPLYHSPFGHHMFAYFGDQPWIHLRRTKAQILDYARAHGIEARVRRDFGISLETYLDEMLNFDHVNGLLLDQYGLDAFQARADVEIIKFNRSYEGANLLSSAIVEEIPHIERERLIEHGFELAFRRR